MQVLFAFPGAVIDRSSKLLLAQAAARFDWTVAALLVVLEPEAGAIQPAGQIDGLPAEQAHEPFLASLFDLLEPQASREDFRFGASEKGRSMNLGVSRLIEQPFNLRFRSGPGHGSYRFEICRFNLQRIAIEACAHHGQAAGTPAACVFSDRLRGADLG